MPRRPIPAPRYRLHKPSGQAVVTVRTADGKRQDVYLGRYDSPASLEEYRRVLAQLAAGRPVAPAHAPPQASACSVAELLLAFLGHARETYRTPDGEPTPTYDRIAASLRKLRELYAHTPAAELGPKDLKVSGSTGHPSGFGNTSDPRPPLDLPSRVRGLRTCTGGT